MLTARLIARSHLSRTILVEGGPQPHTVRYWPWGINSERVLVDELCVARRSGWHNMTGGYLFRMGQFNASLIVAIPAWCELLPVRDLTFVQLAVEGQVLYQEGNPPTRAFEWTSPASAFPVIPFSAAPPLPPPPLSGQVH